MIKFSWAESCHQEVMLVSRGFGGDGSIAIVSNFTILLWNFIYHYQKQMNSNNPNDLITCKILHLKTVKIAITSSASILETCP
jgi:hypothetical protein